MQNKRKYQKFFGENLPEIYRPFLCENSLYLLLILVFFILTMTTASFEMIAHHFCEGMEKEFHRSLILQFLLFFYFVYGFLDMVGDIMGIFCSFQDEIVIISGGIEDNIPFIEEGVEK